MEPGHSERRGEERFLIDAGAAVTVKMDGQVECTTVDISGRGVLLAIQSPGPPCGGR